MEKLRGRLPKRDFDRLQFCFSNVSELIHSTDDLAIRQEILSQLYHLTDCLAFRGPGPSTQSQSERNLITQKLNGFNYETSRIKPILQQYNWEEMKMTELSAIALALSEYTGIKMDREDKRRKEVLLKWFEDNLDSFLLLLPSIKLTYDR
jgi:hypothetical protein